ncbi:MAG TPA: hypothetical protein VGD67_13990 [Pseudonocardiaceae bacterium]
MRIGLVGCVKEKVHAPAPARDLYVSPLFVGRRGFVERSCDRWFVLSGRHGLVAPSTVLAPYDQSLADSSPAERHSWSRRVLDELAAAVGPLGRHTYEIHADETYRDHGLAAGLLAAGATVEVPARGLRHEEQLVFYARHVRAAASPTRPGTRPARTPPETPGG